MATATTKSKLSLDIKITLELSLHEARALECMVGYGIKPFIEGYYKQLGRSYMQPHEAGLTAFFETIKQNLTPEIHKADQIVKAINKVKLIS